MGLPALAIPEALIEDLPEILRDEGFEVSVDELGAEHRRIEIVLALSCAARDGGRVHVRIQRVSKTPPGCLLAVLEPGSIGVRNLSKDDRLLNRIEDVLIARGAIGREKKSRSKNG